LKVKKDKKLKINKNNTRTTARMCHCFPEQQKIKNQ